MARSLCYLKFVESVQMIVDEILIVFTDSLTPLSMVEQGLSDLLYARQQAQQAVCIAYNLIVHEMESDGNQHFRALSCCSRPKIGT